MRYLILVPLGFMVVAVVILHGAACGMHAWAVERMWRNNPATRSEYKWSHAYCKFAAAPFKRLGL